MDFSKFDNRTPAENGLPMDVKDPDTGEIVTHEGQPCQVIVRGTASKTIQDSIRRQQQEQMAKPKPKEGESQEEEKARVLEDVHESLVTQAIPFVAGFVNIERPDGRGTRPLTADEDDVRWFLGLTFPTLGLAAEKDEKGESKFEMKNEPFAQQVLTFASRSFSSMGNGSKK